MPKVRQEGRRWRGGTAAACRADACAERVRWTRACAAVAGTVAQLPGVVPCVRRWCAGPHGLAPPLARAGGFDHV